MVKRIGRACKVAPPSIVQTLMTVIQDHRDAVNPGTGGRRRIERDALQITLPGWRRALQAPD